MPISAQGVPPAGSGQEGFRNDSSRAAGGKLPAAMLIHRDSSIAISVPAIVWGDFDHHGLGHLLSPAGHSPRKIQAGHS